MIFLQIVTPSNIVQTENLFSVLSKGGVLMIPLAFMLFLAFYIFLKKLFFIQRRMRVDEHFMNLIKDNLAGDNIEAAIIQAKNTGHSVGKIVYKGLRHINSPINDIERDMENTARLELYTIEKGNSILSIIGYIAPLFGFLGTIIGMFQLFYEIASTGEYTISVIAGGIYVKMISSASGLIIGIIAYLGYRILQQYVESAENKLETAIVSFVDVVTSIRKKQ
ncbi:MAG: MotA/TolQ/ExbB proton channel family protein [Chitinophagaceae bacterium]